nr:hypothetical protein [Tanacetum cinerariifolium]
YVVPTGRVVVPSGRYVVPSGRVVVPTGRVVVPSGSYKDVSYAAFKGGGIKTEGGKDKR